MQGGYCYLECYSLRGLGVNSENLVGFQVLQEDRAVMKFSCVMIFREFMVC